MSDHQIIWLQPWCEECEKHVHSIESGRTWCKDNPYDPCECGAMPVKYVIAPDQPQKPIPESDK
jgi:hypothetical protein